MGIFKKIILYLTVIISALPFMFAKAETNEGKVCEFNVGICLNLGGDIGFKTYMYNLQNRKQSEKAEFYFPVFISGTDADSEIPYGMPLDTAVRNSNCAVVAEVISKERYDLTLKEQNITLDLFEIKLKVKEVIYGEVDEEYITAVGQGMFRQIGNEKINFSRLYNGDTFIFTLKKTDKFILKEGIFYEFTCGDRINLSKPEETFWQTDGRWSADDIEEYFVPSDKDDIIRYLKELWDSYYTV
ncbi:MAG: hypothetical protein J6M16_08020 [Clostridia bacterium]|nr:hypothetical protein [Clostridia bacterium]